MQITSGRVSDFDDSEAIRMIVGRWLSHAFPPHGARRRDFGVLTTSQPPGSCARHRSA
jgi:hypothetical protein